MGSGWQPPYRFSHVHATGRGESRTSSLPESEAIHQLTGANLVWPSELNPPLIYLARKSPAGSGGAIRQGCDHPMHNWRIPC